MYIFGYNDLEPALVSSYDEPATWAEMDEPDRPNVWFRTLLRRGSIGPGKVELMRLVASTGSVSAAARALGMSHARSVKLVAELNALGAGPLIETRTGGDAGGGARLTDRGERVLGLHDELAHELRRCAGAKLAQLEEALGDG